MASNNKAEDAANENGKQIAKLHTKVAVVEKTLDSHAAIFEHLANSQNQISYVLSELREMHVEQRARTTIIEKEIDHFSANNESRRSEVAAMIKELKKEIKEEFTELKSDIKDLQDDFDALNNWRWMIIGACTVIGVVVGVVAKAMGWV